VPRKLLSFSLSLSLTKYIQPLLDETIFQLEHLPTLCITFSLVCRTQCYEYAIYRCMLQWLIEW
jgi:hypothetical protein